MSPAARVYPAAPTAEELRRHLANIVQAYPSRVVRAYSRVRFLIIRQQFLDAVGQYLPDRGAILDIGCGFGLFGLYFSGLHPGRHVHGYDLDRGRVETARNAAKALGVTNADFDQGDAASLALERQFVAAYALDIIHHLPRLAVPGFLASIHSCLAPGGRFLIKDVDHDPAYKRWFTLVLDRVMVGLTEPIHYWPREELRAVLRDVGFTVYTHQMRDVLPYPHILYVCEKERESGAAAAVERQAAVRQTPRG